MASDDLMPGPSAWIARWWIPVLRGVAAILFGITALAVPATGLLTLLILWGAYALVDGVFSVILATRRGRAGKRWGFLMFEGSVSIFAGLFTFASPGMTALALLIVIALRAVINGVAEIGTAIRLRRELEGEWLLALSGVLSIVFGSLALMFPGAGALAVVWMIGIYAMGFGVLLVALGMRLHLSEPSAEEGTPA